MTNTNIKIKYKRNKNNCHICISHKPGTDGYITIMFNYKRFLIHRYIWEQRNGTIPNGLCILHKCDTPACINLKHLRLGTQQDNIKDMEQKGRRATFKGERNGNAKLTTTQVKEIRKRYTNKSVFQQQLAREYGVSDALINHIISNKLWKHI